MISSTVEGVTLNNASD